jgi:hypothetical protein
VAGGFPGGEYDNKACIVSRSRDAVTQMAGDQYCSNKAEADDRVWFHVHQCPCDKVSNYSPDLDVLMVGLLTLQQWSSPNRGDARRKQAFVQISRTRGEEKNQPGIVDVKRLAQKLVEHPDLQSISEEKRVECVVSLLVMTGCDFTSYISDSIKPASLACSFRMPSAHTLADWSVLLGERGGLEPGRIHIVPVPHELGHAFGAFLRMIGVSYYTRHKLRLQEQTAERSFIAVGGSCSSRVVA